MAGLITVSHSLEIVHSNFIIPRHTKSGSLLQTNIGGNVPGQVLATTGGLNIDLTALGLTGRGWLMMYNLDPTNFVTWGGTTDQIGQLMPNEPGALFRLRPGFATLRLVADTASCKVQLLVQEN